MPQIAKTRVDSLSIKNSKESFDEQNINTFLVINKVKNQCINLYIEVR